MARVRIGVVGTGWWSTQSPHPGPARVRARRRRRARRPRPGQPRPRGRTLRRRPHVRGPPGAPRGGRRRRRGRRRPAHLPLRDRTRRARRRRWASSSRSRWCCAPPRRGTSSRVREAAELPLVVGYTFQFTRRGGARAAGAPGRRDRRPAARLGPLRLDGAVVATLAAGRLRRRLRVPAHRAEAGHLLRPRDLGRRPGADPDHARDGDGAVGDRRPRDRGLRADEQRRPRRSTS